MATWHVWKASMRFLEGKHTTHTPPHTHHPHYTTTPPCIHQSRVAIAVVVVAVVVAYAGLYLVVSTVDAHHADGVTTRHALN
jgi:hypothetical protein